MKTARGGHSKNTGGMVILRPHASDSLVKNYVNVPLRCEMDEDGHR
jgi:hypothetical protein